MQLYNFNFGIKCRDFIISELRVLCTVLLCFFIARLQRVLAHLHKVISSFLQQHGAHILRLLLAAAVITVLVTIAQT
jgi:hypothetical protein